MTTRTTMSGCRYPRMVHRHTVQTVAAHMAQRRERLDSLRTKADAERYVRRVRRAVKRAFGPFPRRTPLNARATGSDAYPWYTLEKVVFESRPGFFVTGNLYIPRDRAPGEKRPGVLGLCGHWGGGKSCDLYQSFCQGLAAKGFVVFIIDPICQGERRQFTPSDGGRRPGLCHAHNLIGNALILADEFFGTWRAWDAVRGLDYLLSRPEVDRSRVGVTGNSGGGTLSSYLTALDSRLTMAAPSCYICSWDANLNNELPADAEQNPPGLLAAGLDEADLLLCYAPRPTLILAQEDDFFDERAARRAYEDVARVHALLGSRDSAAYFAGPCQHGYSRENREAMYAFFLEQAGLSGTPTEEHVAPVGERALWVLPRGDTSRAGSRRVFDFLDEEIKRLKKDRGRPPAESVMESAAALLDVTGPGGPPPYRALRSIGRTGLKDFPRASFAVETEPGIEAIVSRIGSDVPIVHPPKGDVLLYVGHFSADDDVRRIEEIGGMTRGRRAFVAVDPRGIGQSMAGTCGSKTLLEPYGADYLYAATAEMLDRPMLGRRVFDVMRTMDFLLANGAEEIRLVGRGLGSVTAAFAALLHPARPRVRLLNYLPSYELLVRARQFDWPLSALLRGCLKHFDLPDVYRVLGRRLRRSRPWGATIGRAPNK